MNKQTYEKYLNFTIGSKNDRQVLSSEYDKEQTNNHLHGRFSFTKWDKVKSYPPNYTSYSFAPDSTLQSVLSRSNVLMHTHTHTPLSRYVSAFTHAHHIFIILDVCGFFLGITWFYFIWILFSILFCSSFASRSLNSYTNMWWIWKFKSKRMSQIQVPITIFFNGMLCPPKCFFCVFFSQQLRFK